MEGKCYYKSIRSKVRFREDTVLKGHLEKIRVLDIIITSFLRGHGEVFAVQDRLYLLGLFDAVL